MKGVANYRRHQTLPFAMQRGQQISNVLAANFNRPKIHCSICKPTKLDFPQKFL
jgi:hypothetical protein